MLAPNMFLLLIALAVGTFIISVLYKKRQEKLLAEALIDSLPEVLPGIYDDDKGTALILTYHPDSRAAMADLMKKKDLWSKLGVTKKRVVSMVANHEWKSGEEVRVCALLIHYEAGP